MIVGSGKDEHHSGGSNNVGKIAGDDTDQDHEDGHVVVPLLLVILKAAGMIGGKTFTDRYGINRWNLNTLQKEPQRDIFQAAWLAYLVRDYGVSAHWLLTGEGQPQTEDQAAR